MTVETVAPTLQINPLSNVMAAEITGIDLSKPLSDRDRQAIHNAFLAHQILVFRGQKLTKEQQVAFTEQFGTLERHTKRNQGTDSHPLVHVVSNLGADGKPTGKVNSTQWHSDKSFRPEPSMATILHAVTLPPDGGDTCFANMYLAYETLSDNEKVELEGVKVVHSWEHSRENIGKTLSPEEIADAPPMAHPLARTHPETGRKALFLGMHAAFIDGVDRDTGLARIEALEAHATDDRFTYRHNWREGDVLMWDNRCLLHRADPNFDAAMHPRVLHRTCLRGNPTS
ncbi:MAG: TauD/TfdA family dioxygenase [Alphaproteobacteria bacterium]|nr:TauD/TfdA family dioxygenase [Alphaproteobacteria bacterium]